MKTIDGYIAKNKTWEEALIFLRSILQETELQETVKWGMPVYVINNKNVLGIGAFKSYVGLWFYQGVFLKDRQNKLVNAQEGVTKAMRQWRFNSFDDLRADADLVREYVEEAIANQLAGKELKPEKKKPLEMPAGFKQALAKDAELKDAFSRFTPARQNEFIEYLLQAKREETRKKRQEKIIPLIKQNIGLHDKYK
ncbi:MAG: YdeI/OmpD-associated family protein [Bacteroidia bacterium]